MVLPDCSPMRSTGPLPIISERGFSSHIDVPSAEPCELSKVRPPFLTNSSKRREDAHTTGDGMVLRKGKQKDDY
jgi:hypothetical protein